MPQRKNSESPTAAYEHKLVMAERVQEHLDAGWEPVPNVEPVITNRSAPNPFVKVFLRRKR